MTAALRVFEYNARVYRRIWRATLFLTFLAPMLFLASMGVGLGRLIDGAGGAAALGGVKYAVFLAPGLLVAQAMQTAGFESTYPIMGRIVWHRIYPGMLATPITVPAIVFGQLAWMAVRLLLVNSIFFVVMIGFGVVGSPLGVLGILGGLAHPGVRIREGRPLEERPGPVVPNAGEGCRGRLADPRFAVAEQANDLDEGVAGSQPVEAVRGEDPDHPIAVSGRAAEGR